MIQLILGPMFSGKSSQLLRKVRRFEIAKRRCLVINYTHDNRYSNEEVMSTHDKLTFKAVKCSTIAEADKIYSSYDVIAIDEGQFFPDVPPHLIQLVEMCERMANEHKVVIVAGLDGTFQRKPFGRILELIPLAEKVIKLSAVCMYCSKDAPFTQRTVDNCEIQLIGGEQCYKPVCRGCFNRPAKQPKSEEETSSLSTQLASNPETVEALH